MFLDFKMYFSPGQRTCIDYWHCNFIRKETPVQVFSCEFCEIFKSIYLCNICVLLFLDFEWLVRLTYGNYNVSATNDPVN